MLYAEFNEYKSAGGDHTPNVTSLLQVERLLEFGTNTNAVSHQVQKKTNKGELGHLAKALAGSSKKRQHISTSSII